MFPKLWKAYLVLSLVSLILNFVGGASGDLVADLAGYAISILGFFAIVGYVEQRRIGWRMLWIAVFVITWGLVPLTLLFDASRGEFAWADMAEYWWLLAIGLLLSAPGIWAAFCYAFRSPHLWNAIARAEG